jgi:8-amino-7-oxononanoate synthase
VTFEQQIQLRLEAIKAAGLYRRLRPLETGQCIQPTMSGNALLNFSSNDYLGLAGHPRLKEAAMEAAARYGAGAGASRLICGSLPPHVDLEEELAQYKNLPAAITFSSGYSTALGAVCSLAGRNDFIIVDKLVHASIVDAARLSSATLRAFAHNDLEQLEKILRWCDKRSGKARPTVLIVTESVFSMDGDVAPLGAIADLKDRYGAWLMVDEAHSTGLYGEKGRGLADHLGISSRIEIHMGTLGKALGSAGGYISGSRGLCELIVNKARSLIFSTAPVPAAAAAARAGIQVAAGEEGARRRNALWQNVEYLTASPGRSTASGSERSAIIPIHIGAEAQALEAAATLLAKGMLVPAIRYPTVGRGKARLRITLSADHTQEQIASLKAELPAEFTFSERGHSCPPKLAHASEVGNPATAGRSPKLKVPSGPKT